MPNIRITELDFDDIKLNLKNYLRTQTEFSDYDFEGSGLAILLDMLAYNTHYNAYLANMVANEMFLDSAVKRESAVSIAKHLQYTPRSVIGAIATLDVTYDVGTDPAPPSLLVMDRYAQFNTVIDNIQYNFVTLEPITASLSGTTYFFEGIQVKEGFPVTNTYNVVNPGPAEKYIIQNENVDITTVRVRVQKSSTDTTTVAYTRVIDVSGFVNATLIGGDDAIFFVEENPFGKFEIFFGDGNIGRKLEPGNIVFIDYLVSSGTSPNVSSTVGAAQIFTGPRINNFSPATIVTTESPNGGQNKETIQEIKFNAPRANAAQNRLVTVDDYKALIKRDVQNLRAVSVWGGQDNDPPIYGKVFISILPTSGNALTKQVKDRIIKEILGDKRVVAITPEIVDPEIFWVNLAVSVKYDVKRTVLTGDQISSLVRTKIQNYFDLNLNTFNENFLYSRLSAAIDSADQSVLGSQTIIKQQIRFVPSLTIANRNRFVLNNVLQEGTLETSRFVYNRNGVFVQARIRDIPDTSTVFKSGSYRRAGSIITATFSSPHNLTEGEEVFLSFTGAALPGNYEIYRVISPTSFSVISPTTGSTSGSIFVTSKPRGTLQLYNPITQQVLLSDVGFVSYQEGIIQLDELFISGYPSGARDIKITVGLVEGSRDINVFRNQILRLDESASVPAIDQLAGLTVTVIPIQ